MEVILAPLSPAQLRKFEKGESVRARLGHHHRVHVSHEHAKKLMSAHKKGAAATIHKHGGRIHLVDVVDNPVVRPVLEASSDRAVRAIEGSGRVYGRPYNARKNGTKSDSDEEMEGMGHPKGPGFAAWMAFHGKDTRAGTTYYEKMKAKWKKDHGHGPTSANAKARRAKSQDAYDQYMHQGAYSDAAIHNRNVAAAKERAAATAQAQQVATHAQNQASKFAARATAAQTAQTNQAMVHTAPHTMPISHPTAHPMAPAPHPHASHLGGGTPPHTVPVYYGNTKVTHVVPLKPLPTSYSGGKVNRLKKFNRWFKSIGQKTKTLNHNLKPIKHAASARAADYITMYNNPQAQAQALLDTSQSEASQFRHLAGRRKKASAPSSGMDMSTALVHYLPDAPTTPFPTQYTVQTAEPIPVDYNNDGVPEGFFYPNEKQYFGGKAHMIYPNGSVHKIGGKAHHKHGGKAVFNQAPVHHSHPGPMSRVGSGAKKTSPWIAHVKAYAAQHGMKYSEALKAAKSTYKKGGALYPAGYDPYSSY